MSLKTTLTKEFLSNHYIRQQKSTREIAAEVGCSKTSVLLALQQHNISPRAHSRLNKPNKKRNLVGLITDSCWFRIQDGAKRRNLMFAITKEYAWLLFQQQKGICALSGRILQFAITESNINKHTQTASLDRIDSSKGYVEGNVQWIHKDVQKMKMDFQQDEFIRLCTSIANVNRK